MLSVTSALSFSTLIAEQRAYFQSGVTLRYWYRVIKARKSYGVRV
jgi:hypothetical protein